MFYRVLLLVLTLQMSFFAASAYTMPADKLMAMGNKQLAEKGQAHWDKNELDSALICFNIIANRSDRKQSIEDMHLVCAATTAMGNIYMHFYDYEKAMQCLLNSENYAKKHHLNWQLPDIYAAMASLEQDKDDFLHDFSFCPEAFELSRKAFNIAAKNGGPQYVMVILMINMITNALGHNRLNLIEDELKTFQNYRIYDTIPARDFAKHQCEAAIYVLHAEYDSALFHLEQLENLIDVDGYSKSDYKMVAHENMYYVHLANKDNAKAILELDAIEQISQEHDIASLTEVLFLKHQFYSAMGNITLADKYDLLYHKAKDKFMAKSNLAKVDEEKILFKLNEANHEIKELSYKQRIQQTELIAVAVVAVLLLALLMLAWLNHRHTKEKNRVLYLQNQQLLANADRMRQMRQEQDAPTEKYGRGKMEGDDISQVMEKVERMMDESEEVYSTEFSLDRLAELTGETESRVSQAINTSGRTYYGMLNEYRVREACRRMSDKEHYSGLTIEAIGQSVGFKSRSNFVSTFKRIIGLTPSAYLKQVGSSTVQPSSSETSDTNQAESWQYFSAKTAPKI